MPISVTTAMPTSFKVELLRAVHDFTSGTGDTFKIALLRTTSAGVGIFGAATTSYNDLGSNEVPAGGGYSTGGNTLTSITPTASGGVGVCNFLDTVWPAASFTACGAVIYNDTAPGKPACAVLSFSGDQQVSGGNFAVRFPPATGGSAIIRVS
jgi:hypothetical protein